MTGQKLTAIDLFAGAGGLSLGLHRAGIDLIFGVEKDRMAFETFRHNFLSEDAAFPAGGRWPEWLPQTPHEIVEFLAHEPYWEALSDLRGKIDLVCGGPPCQGFSVGGARNGADQRNKLPLQYIEFVRRIQPRAVLMENVEGMARAFSSRPSEQPMPFVEWFRDELQRVGYDVHFEVLDASDFGVPQVRRRVFLFGVRRASATQVTMPAQSMFSLLDGAAIAVRKRRSLPFQRHITVLEAIDDLAGAGKVPSPDSPKFMSGTYTEARSAYARAMREGVPTASLPDSHRFSNHTAAMQEVIELVQRTQPYGRLSRQFLRELGTKKQKKVYLDPHSPSSTITTHPDEFIHYSQPRIITIREMARLQSFPDVFQLKGRYTINGDRRRFDAARVSQVGNAVPPLMAEAIGLAMTIILRPKAGCSTSRRCGGC